MVPSSETSIAAPVSSVMLRMVAPPRPMTSRIFSGSILIRDDAWGVLGHLLARLANRLGHPLEDAEAPRVRLRERLLHDLPGDALDLDVHLQRVDAVHGARDLEVHVPEVILVAHDVGNHRELFVLLDKPHRDARNR